MTSLVNVTNDYIAGAHRFYTIGSGTSNDNLTNFSIQPKYETVRIQDSNVFITGSIYPTSCNVYDIGSSNYRWRDLYLSGNTIDLGGTRISRNNDTGGMKISSKVNDTPLDFTAQHITALGTLFASNITIAGNALMIEDNGNVGIGTAIPTQKLDVRGNIYASGNIVCSNISVIGDFVRLDTITSNTEQMVVENAGTGPALKVTQSGANSVAEFYDKESGVALFVGNGGNIGIGTNVPLARLDVNGNALISGNINAETGTFTGSIQNTSVVNDTISSINTNNGAFLSIEAFNVGNTVKRPIALAAYGGNVGIGTNNPTHKLDVVGNIKTSGNIQNSSGRPMINQTGGILQVVNVNTGTTSSSSSTTLLTLNITPSSTSSKILLFATLHEERAAGTTTSHVYVSLRRNGTNIVGNFGNALGWQAPTYLRQAASTTYLDSPATTSSIAYTFYVDHANASGVLYYWYNNSLTAMEVSG